MGDDAAVAHEEAPAIADIVRRLLDAAHQVRIILMRTRRRRLVTAKIAAIVEGAIHLRIIMPGHILPIIPVTFEGMPGTAVIGDGRIINEIDKILNGPSLFRRGERREIV
jgi:hypothetical protein